MQFETKLCKMSAQSYIRNSNTKKGLADGSSDRVPAWQAVQSPVPYQKKKKTIQALGTGDSYL
jgi:hypothetical protein